VHFTGVVPGSGYTSRFCTGFGRSGSAVAPGSELLIGRKPGGVGIVTVADGPTKVVGVIRTVVVVGNVTYSSVVPPTKTVSGPP
jgi:hypothetical protein